MTLFQRVLASLSLAGMAMIYAGVLWDAARPGIGPLIFESAAIITAILAVTISFRHIWKLPH